MNKILVLTVLVALALAFKAQDKSSVMFKDTNLYAGSNLKACSNNQLSTVYNAISSCQTSSISDSIGCIQSYMSNRISEAWNVFARTSTSSDAVMFWYFNGCYVALNNYGKFSRLYIMWPARSYAVEKSLTTQDVPTQIKTFKEGETEYQIVGACASDRVSAVSSAVSQCNISGNADAALCIIDKLESTLGQAWNSWVATGGSSITYYYYSECAISYTNYGSYNRWISVWKASP